MNEAPTPPPPIRLLRLAQVLEQTGLGRTSIYNFIKNRDFPRPISLGSRASRWVEQEVQSWIRKRINSRDGLSQAKES